MSEPNFNPVHLPRHEVPVESPKSGGPPFRIQRGTVTAILAVMGPLLVGGVIAEVFHTGQVYSSAISRYSAETDKATKEGLEILTKGINVAITKAGINRNEATAQAEQKIQSASIEATRIRTEATPDFLASAVVLPGVNLDVRGERVLFYESFFESMAKFRSQVASSTLGIGVKYVDEERGFSGRRVFPVPYKLTLKEVERICSFECFQLDHNQERCADEWEASAASNKENPPAEDKTMAPWLLILSEEQRVQLGTYRQSLRDLEAIVLTKTLDLERYKKGNPNPTGKEAQWLNRELARLSRSLQNIRQHMNLVAEMEFLGSSAQRSSAASAYQALDFLRINFEREGARGQSFESVTSWLQHGMPGKLQAVMWESQKELSSAASYRYWGVRPVLANIWFWNHIGHFYPGRFFQDLESEQPVSLSLNAPDTAKSLAIPTAIVTIPLILLIGCGGYFLFRKSTKAFLWAGGALALLTLFQVQSAFQYNGYTEDTASSIISAVVSSVEAYPFAKRASELSTEIEVDAGRESSQKINQSEVSGNLIKAKADQAWKIANSSMKCAGLSVVDTSGMFEIEEQWILKESEGKSKEIIEQLLFIDQMLGYAENTMRRKGPEPTRRDRNMPLQLRRNPPLVRSIP